MAVDYRQDIIEIVSHAAGKLADALHLLGLAQLLFQPLLSSDVPEQRQQQGGTAMQLHQRTGIFNREDLAAAKCDPPLDELVNDPVLKSFFVPLEHFIGLFGVGIDYREWLALQLVATHAD